MFHSNHDCVIITDRKNTFERIYHDLVYLPRQGEAILVDGLECSVLRIIHDPVFRTVRVIVK